MKAKKISRRTFIANGSIHVRVERVAIVAGTRRATIIQGSAALSHRGMLLHLPIRKGSRSVISLFEPVAPGI
jgi:hypothetical protein